MSSVPTTRILSAIDDVIYVEVTGSLSKWETHFFLSTFNHLGPKKSYSD